MSMGEVFSFGAGLTPAAFLNGQLSPFLVKAHINELLQIGRHFDRAVEAEGCSTKLGELRRGGIFDEKRPVRRALAVAFRRRQGNSRSTYKET